MSSPISIKALDGETIQQLESGVYYWWPWETDHICCDCGLTHKVRIEMVHTGGKGKRKYKLMASWERNEKETKHQRKHMKCVVRKTR